jgi:uncharacterized protein
VGLVFRRRTRRPWLASLREAVYPRRGWGRAIEYIGHRVKRLPDSPHRIALGFACGVFTSFTPLFGLHFVLAAGLAWLLRGNIVASLIGTAFGNPITFPIIASTSLTLGRRILGYGVSGRDFGRVVDALSEGAAGFWRGLLGLIGYGDGGFGRLVPLFTDIIWPYLVGGLLPGLVTATASYYLARPLIGAYQKRRRNRMRNRAHRRVHAVKRGAEGLD